jgi:hypothetical protein
MPVLSHQGLEQLSFNPPNPVSLASWRVVLLIRHEGFNACFAWLLGCNGVWRSCQCSDTRDRIREPKLRKRMGSSTGPYNDCHSIGCHEMLKSILRTCVCRLRKWEARHHHRKQVHVIVRNSKLNIIRHLRVATKYLHFTAIRRYTSDRRTLSQPNGDIFTLLALHIHVHVL